MLQSAAGLSRPRRGKKTPKHLFHAMVYERFWTMSFAAKEKRLDMQFASPIFRRLDFLLTQRERKNALFAKQTIELWIPRGGSVGKVIRRGSSVVVERANVGRVDEDERCNQARHLDDSHSSFPAVGNEFDPRWQSSRAWPQTVVDKVEY
jgi:hypothetical protein